MDGIFEPGNSFDWSSYGFGVTSTVYLVDERSRVLWGGAAGGITGVHEWTFNDSPDGVRVATTESFAGSPVEADPDGNAIDARRLFGGVASTLKVASEQH